MFKRRLLAVLAALTIASLSMGSVAFAQGGVEDPGCPRHVDLPGCP